MQSIYFCQTIGDLSLTIYIPSHTQALMHFEKNVVAIDLDSSYLTCPETAKAHVDELLRDQGVAYEIFEPRRFTASTLPNLPVDWRVMACPRVMSEKTSRIGIGHIGPKVRAIVKHADFPIFIPSVCFKQWSAISAFFGGSTVGLHAVQQALHLAERTGLPMTLYTQINGTSRRHCEDRMAEAGLADDLQKPNRRWVFFESGTLEENLYSVDPSSLTVVGGAGESLMRQLVFGSKLEIIQKTLPNPLVVVGPECRTIL